ncbi:alpha/beta hydrolase [Sulfoacidibacillus thermotolerans]|uniref:Alpha/beta hydrolase fold-3 domain-containing protein n=1 Tax=Sulfoacidibacillus thermotolerans TaxID=1765684 RepID=A0A2U3D835_SULT2|nr:alpha/beta hydrolase [Sulfoacidibacillus thermotolerans]PWI57454.1 hypothetical protein BM613_08240 [Sulfoacidibacillus thermotolerans]
MSLDPELVDLLAKTPPVALPPQNDIPITQARIAYTMARKSSFAPIPLHRVVDERWQALDREISVRIYVPEARLLLPVLLYYHGGGWVFGNVDTHDQLCRILSKEVGCIVVSVDYRLAPEHPFPAAVNDAYDALQLAAREIVRFHGDPSRIAVAGDSSGGNLAAAVCLMAREDQSRTVSPIFQALIYPVTDLSTDFPSYTAYGQGYGLTKESMEWYIKQYVNHTNERQNPFAAPLQAEDLSELPAALVLTAEFDPLRDEAEAYATKLATAGIPVTVSRYPGMIHGFVNMLSLTQSKNAISQISESLRKAFAPK